MTTTREDKFANKYNVNGKEVVFTPSWDNKSEEAISLVLQYHINDSDFTDLNHVIISAYVFIVHLDLGNAA